MSKPVLKISELHASVEEKDILKGVNMVVKGGEIHAIMGPNGTGKSTLASVIMGHPNYTVQSGAVDLDGQDVLEMEVDERARAGIFLGMQYPSEIGGVTNADFLRTAINTKKEAGEEVSLFKFAKGLDNATNKLEMRKDLPHRYLNVGFSGGEKKRNEILQLLMLEPKIAILDEIDSGLDIDALRIVGTNITAVVKERKDEMGVIIITHYQRLLDYVKPDFVHVFMEGRIVKTGDYSLAQKLEKDGYDWLKEELGIKTFTEEQTAVAAEKIRMGTCFVPKK
ncbi:SufBCD Fe-S cluster assembly scaffold protein [Erysipelotrichaceae bacterium]|nr:SufBCD Fe-S cluster assembly scaffold protein [Erysipelotrichaceae bacterium]